MEFHGKDEQNKEEKSFLCSQQEESQKLRQEADMSLN